MLIQQILNGLTIGVVYSLVALGYTIVYGILKIVNFAHGDIYMMGAFFTISLTKFLHLNFWLAIVFSAIMTAVLGVIIERIAYRPLRNANRIVPLISALGVSIILDNLAIKIWGTQALSFPSDTVKSTIFKFGSITLSSMQITIFLISISLMILLELFIKYTKVGLAMRATSINTVNSQLMGINTNSIIRLAFIIGSALAAVAGSLIGIYYDAVYPTMGYLVGMKAFTAAVLGGIGSIPGAMMGGLLIGVVESVGAGYLGSQYQDIIAFLILIIILIVRPTGLLGEKRIDKV